MSWFIDTFLPSVFEQTGINHQHWLTRKQTAVCVSNMEGQVMRDEQGLHRYYTIKWDGRRVSMWHSSRNGCGLIEFSQTDEEVDKSRQKAQTEKLASIRRNPKIYARHLESARKKVAYWSRILEFDWADLIAGEDITENDVELTALKLEEAKFELAWLTAAPMQGKS